MKKFILILVYLFSLISNAQSNFSNEFEFSTGVAETSDYTSISGYQMKEYVFDGMKCMVSVKFSDTKIIVQRFDSKTLKEVSSNVYEDLPANSKIINLIRTNDKIILFYSTSLKSGNIVISAREVKNNDGTLLTPVKCFECIGIIPYFQFFQSADKSKILIQYRKIPVTKTDKSSYDVLGFHSITSNLVVLSSTEIKMPYTENIFKLKSFTITNAGAIYFLAMNLEINKIDLREIIGNETKKLSTEDLDSTFSKQEFNSFIMSENLKGNLICNGLYLNGIDVKYKTVGVVGASLSLDQNINGLFHFEISTTGKLINQTIYEFPITLVHQNESKKTKNFNEKNEKSNYAGIANLKITNTVENADGSSLIMATQSKFNGIGDISLGHIIIYKIDNLGSLSWIIKIPRNELIISYYRYEFDFYQHENDIYILFPDVAENNNINQIDAPQPYGELSDSQNLIAYKIDLTSGKYIRNALIDMNNINGINCDHYFIYNYVWVSATEIVREVKTGKNRFVLVKMKLNK